jgi:hypothetical protein
MITRKLFRSVLRVVPAFALASILGCLVGFFAFRIPHGELGVVVSVPLVVAFLLSRFFVLVIPADTPATPERPTTLRIFIVLMALLGLATASLMLPSAVIYALVGLSDVAKGALRLAGWAFLGAIVVLSVDFFATVASCVPLASLFGSLRRNAIECFWKALRAPTHLSVRMRVNLAEPVSHCR